MNPELLIWSLDGVVVDTSGSIIPAVRRTVQNYFGRLLGIRGAGALVSDEDVRAFQLAGGFGEPWVLSAALIRYALSLLPEKAHQTRPPRDAAEAASLLARRSRPIRHLSLGYLQERADFPGFAERLRESGGGWEALAQLLPGGRSHPLLMAEGEIAQGNLVRQMYQEIYLGRKHFSRIEKMPPRFHRGPGLIENEMLQIRQGDLEQLHGRYRGRMALVTDRSREIAQLTLHLLRAEKLFDALVSREDVAAEEARRRRLGEEADLTLPHPFMPLEAASHLDHGGQRPAVYIGSLPDDVRAALAARQVGERPFVAWALPAPTRDPAAVKERLAQAGAERLFDSPVELAAALLGGEAT